ncbi:MAG: inositol monophosphatase [Deltaproteobacteria bacterium]|nr:inositol monophosphatase [Deltaproteobacteria bacterium]MBW1953080.1 inositol monophosphatase [Deltaproteobacteria bacterium]MBW1987177.1 inositol monophosphatase [Deltaproteobacteria bacterium]MBW2135039.1 inositol monophosphatase [Deltaproteobacteria bacterium]
MLDKVQQVGRQAALAAGQLLRQSFSRPKRISYKGVIDPVTESDLKSQDLIVGMILDNFPDHQILAEEQVGPKTSATRDGSWWIIDPLDGTVNFAHGFPMFAVSIAFEQEGIIQYGVVYDPLREELFEARAGQGAWLGGQPIRVSEIGDLDKALLATGFPYDVRQRLDKTLGRFGRLLARAQGVRRAGSAALDLCYLAAGRFDGFWEENLKPWDTAAAALVVAEAGGQLSTFSGDRFQITSANVVASNGLLHSQILKELQP